MENLIARVATAADLSPDVARKAVALIGDFIQREAPEEAVKELFEKAPAFPAIITSSTQTGGEGMGVGLKGLMGVSSGAMGGGGLMALGSELLALGLGMEQIQTVGKEVFAYAREVAGRSGRRRNLRVDSRAFPIYLVGGRRWARSQAFFLAIPKPIGAELLKQRSTARASKRSCPRPRMAFGSNPSIRRRRARGLCDPGGLGRSSRDSIIPTPTRPTPRRSTTSPAERTVCRSYSPARSALMVLASGDSIPPRFTRLSTACVSTRARVSNSILGPMALTTRFVLALSIERSGARPGDCAVAFGLDPFAVSARGPFPADWGAQAGRYVETALALRSKGFRGPFLVADARAVHAAGGSPAQELAFALAAALSLLRLLEGTRSAAWRSPRADRVPAGGRRGRIGDIVEIPRATHRLVAR